jgi:trans-aconitate 2-methyltransferase
MPWNPKTYNQFKAERYAPFFDLIAPLESKPNMQIVDLGCGTGELTSLLLDKFPNAEILGIDSSETMLEEAKNFASATIRFEKRSIEEQLVRNERYDLVFSNAAIQWLDDHKTLLPKIIKLVKPGGQLAIQMPCQDKNILNQLLLQLVQETPYKEALNNFTRRTPVLETDDYAQILFENGGTNINISQKIYPQIAAHQDELYEFISGSAMVPYFEKLNGKIKEEFITEFKNRIKKQFPKTPALYPFKRILMIAKF